MPNYLTQLAKYNEENNITATFSEMKKTARRMQKLNDETGLHVEIESYFLDYADETGELATDNVLAENAINAARRTAA
ncbi:hypothetical protein [Arthrobacter roseus]|uniref:hypothetical protein n=1 Tax=Arthrobacter roseus TaxID=136274 RepID=UPI001964D899|nr:hypothetical protein [Arthrobacter roseus]MBM7847510.1 ABC-type Zn uptake system ZnuABC Zn-binding protein ZnuA [Arthrobacter roseus]